MKTLFHFSLGPIFLFIYSIVIVAGTGGGGSFNSHSLDDIENTDTPDTKMLHIRFPLVLECKIPKDDDKKLTNTKWFKDNEPLDLEHKYYGTIKDNTSLIVTSASINDTGIYLCEADQGSFEINVIYLSYKVLPKSMTVLQGDKLTITCDVGGIPEPSILWFKKEKEIEEPVEVAINETRFSLSMNDRNVTNAVFTIGSAIFDDRAEYRCNIKSGSIQYNTTTFVRVKDMYAALWPFLGICAEVFILCLIILIYEKKRAKSDFEESDTDQPSSDTKTKSDHNKDSIRQRK